MGERIIAFHVRRKEEYIFLIQHVNNHGRLLDNINFFCYTLVLSKRNESKIWIRGKKFKYVYHTAHMISFSSSNKLFFKNQLFFTLQYQYVVVLWSNLISISWQTFILEYPDRIDIMIHYFRHKLSVAQKSESLCSIVSTKPRVHRNRPQFAEIKSFMCGEFGVKKATHIHSKLTSNEK